MNLKFLVKSVFAAYIVLFFNFAIGDTIYFRSEGGKIVILRNVQLLSYKIDGRDSLFSLDYGTPNNIDNTAFSKCSLFKIQLGVFDKSKPSYMTVKEEPPSSAINSHPGRTSSYQSDTPKKTFTTPKANKSYSHKTKTETFSQGRPIMDKNKGDAGHGFSYKNVSFRNASSKYIYCMGELTNNSGKDYKRVMVNLSVYDDRGRLIATDNVALLNLKNGGTKSFKGLISDLRAENVYSFKIQYDYSY